jgi:hypothetical protein
VGIKAQSGAPQHDKACNIASALLYNPVIQQYYPPLINVDASHFRLRSECARAEVSLEPRHSFFYTRRESGTVLRERLRILEIIHILPVVYDVACSIVKAPKLKNVLI